MKDNLKPYIAPDLDATDEESEAMNDCLNSQIAFWELEKKLETGKISPASYLKEKLDMLAGELERVRYDVAAEDRIVRSNLRAIGRSLGVCNISPIVGPSDESPDGAA